MQEGKGNKHSVGGRTGNGQRQRGKETDRVKDMGMEEWQRAQGPAKETWVKERWNEG